MIANLWCFMFKRNDIIAKLIIRSNPFVIKPTFVAMWSINEEFGWFTGIYQAKTISNPDRCRSMDILNRIHSISIISLWMVFVPIGMLVETYLLLVCEHINEIHVEWIQQTYKATFMLNTDRRICGNFHHFNSKCPHRATPLLIKPNNIYSNTKRELTKLISIYNKITNRITKVCLIIQPFTFHPIQTTHLHSI